MKRLVVLVLLLTLVQVGTPAQGGPWGTSRIRHMTRVERVSRGIRPVISHRPLHRYARQWSRWMSDNATLRDPKVPCAGGGANVGVSVSVWRIHRAFMHSPEHRWNILNPVYRRVGIASYRQDGMVWVTEVFCP